MRAIEFGYPRAAFFDDRVTSASLDFVRAPVLAHSSRGSPFVRWVPVGMPRIPSGTLDCVCYLYETEEDARLGKKFGGTGFLVSVPSRHPGRCFFYAVTNRHVACQGASIVRVSTHDGISDIFSYDPEQWQFDSRYDIAVVPLQLRREFHKYKLIDVSSFLTKEDISIQDIGPGEDVFMVGRFVDHDGGVTTLPAVRFGNISVMPAPVIQENIGITDAFCIDLHSRSGYSGSPVFVYRTPGFDLEDKGLRPEQPMLLKAGTLLFLLLGIHFAQFKEEWQIDAPVQASETISRVPLVKDRNGIYVKGFSGMSCVLPAWCILEVLNMPRLKQWREEADDREAERRRVEGLPPEPEVTA